MARSRIPERFVGYWRITEMTVRGWLDCRFCDQDGVLTVDFSWEGENDNDPACGRG